MGAVAHLQPTRINSREEQRAPNEDSTRHSPLKACSTGQSKVSSTITTSFHSLNERVEIKNTIRSTTHLLIVQPEEGPS